MTKDQIIKIINDVVYGRIYGLRAALNDDYAPANVLYNELLSAGVLKVDEPMKPREFWINIEEKTVFNDVDSARNSLQWKVVESVEKAPKRIIHVREVTESEKVLVKNTSLADGIYQMSEQPQEQTESEPKKETMEDIWGLNKQPQEKTAEDKILQKLFKTREYWSTNTTERKGRSWEINNHLIEYFESKVK